MAGHHVHLDAKGRHGKIVDDVLAGQDQLDIASHRNVQLVNLLQPRRLLRFPHPLFGDDVDIQRVHRGAAIVHIDDRAPAEHGQSEKQRNRNPRGFQAHVAMNGNAHLLRMRAAVLEKEKDDRGGNQDGEKQTDGGDVDHQAVHAGREVGRLLRS